MLRRLGFAGRIMAIVLLALVVLSAAGMTLSFLAARAQVETDAWSTLPERAAALVELLDHADLHNRALILKAFNSQDVRVGVVARRPNEDGGHTRLPGVEWIIGQFLRDVGAREVIAEHTGEPRRRWLPVRFGQLQAYAREPLRVSIALTSGDYVQFETRVEISPGVLGIPPGFGIGAVGALVGIAALLAIAREARPLRELSASVAQFAVHALPQPVTPRGAPEIAALIGTVNEMQTRIAALLKGRTMLLGAISHDLKTFITRLRLRVEGIPDPEQLEKAARDLDDMTALIDDALAVARGAMISERRERLDLAALVAEEAAERRQHGVELVSPASPRSIMVAGDATALRRLFGNLIDNAREHGRVVQVMLQPDRDRVHAIVDDDGPGIPENERAAVFEPFYRLDPSRSRGTGGSGLGLAIARQIAAGHGGAVAVETSPLGGARLVVTLPLASDA